MKRKRSVRMITKLLILSLILGLCLPSFTDQVLAEEANSDYSLNIGANEKNDGTGSTIYGVGFQKENSQTVSGKMKFDVEVTDLVGKLKYIVLYNNLFSNADDSGFLSGIDIPLQETETDYDGYIISWTVRKKTKTKDCRFTGITFEDSRLQWNFYNNAATDRKYIIVNDTNQRIPIYFLGAYNGGSSRVNMERVSENEVASVNSSMSELYHLVDEISASNGQVNNYYPEHAELLKEVSCEVRRILERQTSVNYDKSYQFPEKEEEWVSSAETSYWKTGSYSKNMFLGMKKIIDGYVDYVNTHKIAEPVINSVKINDVETSVNNETHEIIISGKAEDFADRSLSELEITLPDGVTGSWGDSTKFSDTGLAYHVWPYNENLGDAGKDKYKDLGQDYTVKFDIREQTYTPEVKISPENLTGAKADQESYTDPKTKKTTYTVTASSQTEEVKDQQGQHYAFSHWELDKANQELESAKRYSDNVTRKVHNNTDRMQSFVMPSNPLTITAVYKPAYKITMENVGLDKEDFELSASGVMLKGWNPENSEVELYYYDRTVPKGYLVKEVHVSTNDGTTIKSTRSSKSGTNYIRFTMPSDDVKVTVTFEKDKDNERKLTLGEPTGTIIAGKGGTATYELTAEGYSEDATFTVVESYNTGIAKDPVTEGLTVALDKGTSGKGTVTVTVSPEVESDEYYFCVTPSQGKKTIVGTITVLPADIKMLKVENASIALKENESGEVKIKGSSLNLSAGASVEAFETNQDGQIKYSGKTEGLTFDKAVLNNDAFTLTAHVSKTVAKGEYYFIVKADNEQSAVAKLTVDREKAETPDQPEKETQKITVTSNASQGSIQIKVAGGSEELISGTGTVKAVEGDTVTVTAMPKDGYKLSLWKITQGMKDVALSSGSLSDTSVSFVMPVASGSDTVTVGATFDKTSTDPVVTSEPKITAFSVANVSGTIDQNSGTITVVVPNGTDVTSLCPAIATSDADSVAPASGAAVDFTNAVTYTVKNASGAQKSYVVTVKAQEASVSDTLWDKITSPEGDRSWWKKADSIKSHKKNKYPKYW